MSGRYLLDTNIVVALFAEDPAVKEALVKADEVFTPSVTLGKLYFGAWKLGRPKENLARIDEFAADNVVLGCDTDTARLLCPLSVTERPCLGLSAPLTP